MELHGGGSDDTGNAPIPIATQLLLSGYRALKGIMLVAYLDEFGHVRPYIGPDHEKFNEHPVFGYGGYVIPAISIRKFEGFF